MPPPYPRIPHTQVKTLTGSAVSINCCLILNQRSMHGKRSDESVFVYQDEKVNKKEKENQQKQLLRIFKKKAVQKLSTVTQGLKL